MRFQCAPLSPRVDAICDVHTRVNVCLVLRHPTVGVRTAELRLRTTRTDVSAGVARLAGVGGIHELNRYPCVEGFILDSRCEPCERPRVETPIHPLTIVQLLANVRQVFKRDNRVFELLCVFHSLPRRLLDNIRQGVLIVVKTFVDPPVGITFLQTTEGREHFFAELSCPPAIEQHGLGWSTVLTGTARQEFGFTDIEPDYCWVVWFVWICDLVLDGYMQHPGSAVFLQSKLTDRYVAVEQVMPQLALGWIDAERNPEGVATPCLWNTPAELVLAVFGVVETPPTIGESNRVVVVHFRRVVRLAELWNVGLERVLGVGRERVRRHDIVDRCLRFCTALECVFEGTAIRCHCALKPSLLVCRGWRERGFERFRGGRAHTQLLGLVIVKSNQLLNIYDYKPEHRSERRRVRTIERRERRTRSDVARARSTRNKSVGHRWPTVGMTAQIFERIHPQPKGQSLLISRGCNSPRWKPSPSTCS